MNKLLRKPEWIRSQLASKDKIKKVDKILRDNCLVTVCEEANCPNRGECFCRGTATFMIMGGICTRNCRFCNVKHGKPNSLDLDEPQKIAHAVKEMKLRYVVITSVDRDDLDDGGANHFANCIKAIRAQNANVKIEILTPDFRGCLENALDIFASAPADVFNHNIETVPRLYQKACSSSDYELSLNLLLAYKNRFENTPTKSGMMLGLGETDAEVEVVLADLRAHKVDMLTLGQYLSPTYKHLPIERYVTPQQFDVFAVLAKKMGFSHVASGPLVRSSYMADRQFSSEHE